jgi:hypothetical protein
LDKNAQAYSTFKLLIAAIVALAILMILMPIIGSVIGILENDPNDKARELLNNLYNQPEALKTTEDVTFSPDYVLSSTSLSEKIPLSSEQICMSKGDYEDEDNFELQLDHRHRIVWKGSSKKTVKIVVTCNINLDYLMEGIEGTIFEDRGWDSSLDCSVCENRGRCCLVALKTP